MVCTYRETRWRKFQQIGQLSPHFMPTTRTIKRGYTVPPTPTYHPTLVLQLPLSLSPLFLTLGPIHERRYYSMGTGHKRRVTE